MEQGAIHKSFWVLSELRETGTLQCFEQWTMAKHSTCTWLRGIRWRGGGGSMQKQYQQRRNKHIHWYNSSTKTIILYRTVPYSNILIYNYSLYIYNSQATSTLALTHYTLYITSSACRTEIIWSKNLSPISILCAAEFRKPYLTWGLVITLAAFVHAQLGSSATATLKLHTVFRANTRRELENQNIKCTMCYSVGTL